MNTHNLKDTLIPVRELEDLPLFMNLEEALSKKEEVISFAVKQSPDENIDPRIGELNKVQILAFSQNDNLTTIPEEIESMGNLQRLHFYYNKRLSSLPVNIISKFEHLKWLVIRENNFSTFPEINLPKLERLEISKNKLQEIPSEIGKLKGLNTLLLDFNKIAFISPEIKQLSKLTELDLSENKLEELPVAICELKNLTSLHLSDNPIKKVPEEIGQLSQLKDLSISGTRNNLSKLPESIGKLKNLEILRLSNNKALKTLPKSINQLTKLKKLSIRNTGISKEEIASLKKVLVETEIID